MNPTRLKTGFQCLVFSTNIDDDLKAARLIYILEKTPGVQDWNLDIEDCDHVLRIDYQSMDLDSLLSDLSFFEISLRELPIW
ncbi:MAG: hypothetical protein JJ971_07915 [Balneolaceae bacterium]|nr:hypothetical protein [Balneolaceae bacterium]MBO6546838.1 hypothetical protein [Balneolaceae bacterium]MBO6649198.1 hypothetical protein [Balneolaceae bacterium]